MALTDFTVSALPLKPVWLKRPIPVRGKKSCVEEVLSRHGLHTVCSAAKCPNRGECYGLGTATFLILGDRCTRSCRFCAVDKGDMAPVDSLEPARLVSAVGTLGLNYVVITSVTRDDLPDGGASHFASVIVALKASLPAIRIEVLTPDFLGDHAAIKTVLAAGPDVFNHNIETVPRLYQSIRPQAIYERSLAVLQLAAAYRPTIPVKSGLMVGLGEKPDEVVETMRALFTAGCRIVTIGQYLQPSPDQTAVQRYVEPVEFAEYERVGLLMGFHRVLAGPFVRSSYHAAEAGNGCSAK